MRTIKFIAIFLLVLLGIFVLYGIYYGVIFYFFFVKLAVIAAIGAGVIYLYLKTKNLLK